MPVVGSSAYNTAGQITSLVRSLLNDAQGNLFTDAVLLPYVNSAYRKVQRAMGNAGAGGFLTDDTLLVVSAVSTVDSSQQVAVTVTTKRFDHYSLLRTTEELLGLRTFLGAAEKAPSMRAAFHF